MNILPGEDVAYHETFFHPAIAQTRSRRVAGAQIGEESLDPGSALTGCLARSQTRLADQICRLFGDHYNR